MLYCAEHACVTLALMYERSKRTCYLQTLLTKQSSLMLVLLALVQSSADAGTFQLVLSMLVSSCGCTAASTS